MENDADVASVNNDGELAIDIRNIITRTTKPVFDAGFESWHS